VFSPDARLRIAGSSDGKPIAIDASRIARIRPWLSILVKTFRLRGYELLSLTIEGTSAAAHWRVDIESKITGISIPTELVDLIEVRNGQITSQIEFFVPC
jgi:ketosteroid isomerase-like protein